MDVHYPYLLSDFRLRMLYVKVRRKTLLSNRQR